MYHIYVKESKYPVMEYPMKCSILGNHEDHRARIYYVSDIRIAMFRSWGIEEGSKFLCEYAKDKIEKYLDKKYFTFERPFTVREDNSGLYIDLKKNGRLIQRIRATTNKHSLQEVLGRAEMFSGVAVSMNYERA